jgi:hypothetical protein
LVTWTLVTVSAQAFCSKAGASIPKMFLKVVLAMALALSAALKRALSRSGETAKGRERTFGSVHRL